MESVHVQEPIEVRCPFCGGTYTVDGSPPAGTDPYVLHTYPPCSMFVDNDILDFLQAARLQMEGSPS